MKPRVSFLYLALILALFSTRAFGQADTGTISGTVRDATGGVVPDATITAKNIATSAQRTVQTDSTGGYTIPGLTPGTYEVSIDKSGFAPSTLRAEVSVGSHVTLDAQMAVTASIHYGGGGGGSRSGNQHAKPASIATGDAGANRPASQPDTQSL